MAATAISMATVPEAGSGVADYLFSSLYAELRRMARRELLRRGNQGSLGVTSLLHEVYLDIAGRERISFPDQARFMGYAARVMRGLIIDHARNRTTIKRGREFEITPLEFDVAENPVDHKELSAISDALDDLAKVERDLAELVDQKFLCGLSFAEIGALQNLSERTVQRKWEKARIYLRRRIRKDLSL